jgi:sugar O-acyltransferase (sialic acid O-acetyltransferase NeuD family)
MKKAIIGSGGFGREVYHHILSDIDAEIKFFVNDEYADETSAALSTLDINEYEVLIAVGSPHHRQKILNSLPDATKFFSFVHSSAIVLDEFIKVGKGSVICAGSILTTNIVIGDHCHLNLQTTIGHDCRIGDFFTTAPGAKISGNCNIGNRVYFGTNACVKEKINICDDVTIGLNSGVVKHITESGTYVGTPAKLITK